MKKLLPLLILLLATNPAWGNDFIRVLGDVPKMPDMVVQPDTIIRFESSSGRVVELEVQGADWNRIKKFYRASLPSLGWREQGNMVFLRNRETLHFTVVNPDSVRISLKPR